MNIVYLIGNGFDIKLGLKTRYSDFYAWYKKLPQTNNKAVDTFRESILPESDLWSDLELALGKYFMKVKSKEDALAIIYDVRRYLKEYIATENQKVTIKEIGDNREFVSSFFYPYSIFLPKTQERIKVYHSFNDNAFVNVILFNYTDTFERILGWKGNHVTFSIDKHTGYLINIEHIHGYCDNRERLALGVNSTEQIGNLELIEDEEIIDWLVKPAFNDSYELNHHLKCSKWIQEANVIVVYGLSLGETDQTWWDEIATMMMNKLSLILIVYFKRPDYELRCGGPAYQRQIREDKEFVTSRLRLAEKLKVSDTKPETIKILKSVQDRIFPTYSTKLLEVPKGYVT